MSESERNAMWLAEMATLDLLKSMSELRAACYLEQVVKPHPIYRHGGPGWRYDEANDAWERAGVIRAKVFNGWQT